MKVVGRLAGVLRLRPKLDNGRRTQVVSIPVTKSAPIRIVKCRLDAGEEVETVLISSEPPRTPEWRLRHAGQSFEVQNITQNGADGLPKSRGAEGPL
jgi:hypothetical protein